MFETENSKTVALETASNRPGLFPDVTQMTGEWSCRYSSGVGKNENTVMPVVIGNLNGVLPEWGRVQDVQRLFGIRRGTLYTLIASGHIRSVSMRRRGNVRGCRLILLSSVSQYLNGLLQTQESL